MKSADKDAIVTRYRERLAAFGEDIRTLASGVRERQIERYRVLAGIGDMNGRSVLDIGCGFAGFYQFLVDNGVSVDYTGFDICPDFIEICRKKYPAARFAVMDVQEGSALGEFDYVVSSQTFNNRLAEDDNVGVVKDVIRIAYQSCRIGVVVDMLSTYVDFREGHLYYFSPEEIFSFCKSLTKRVALRHDYPLYEFAVYLYKDFQGWGKAATG